MRRSAPFLFLYALLSLVLWACGDNHPPVGSDLRIAPAMSAIGIGDTVTLTASASFGGVTAVATDASWTTSDASIATIRSSEGGVAVIEGVGTGTATITAHLGELTATATVQVGSAKVVSIALTPAMPKVAVGLTLDLVATATYSDNHTADVTAMATWTSGATTIATVDGGAVTGVAKGTATITAALDGVDASIDVEVTDATLASIAITPTNPTVAKGLTRQLTATAVFSDTTTADVTTQVTWATGNAATATVDAGGLLHGAAVGTTAVTATLGGVTGTTQVTVSAATVTSIAVTPPDASLGKGATRAYTATGTFSDATTADLTTQVTWATGNPATATVTSGGVVTAVAPGVTTVSATLGTVTGATSLTVTSATLASIAITPTSPSVAKGLARQFTATGTYTDATTQDLTTQVTWASSNTAVATISNAGITHGLAQTLTTGQSTITATLGGITGTTTLTVTSATLASIAISPTTPSIAKGVTAPFTATGVFTDDSTQDLTTQVTWASSGPAVATISNAPGNQGVLTALTTGQTVVTATSGTITGFTTATITPATLASISISPTNPSVAQGLTRPFTATGIFTDTTTQDLTTQVTWASSDTAVATISNAAGSQGVASTVATGTTAITATLSGKTGSTALTVTPATLVSIAVTPTHPSVARGLDAPFTATGTFTDTTTRDLTTQVTWASSNLAVATVSNAAGSEGLAHAVDPGDATISATLGSVTGSTTITVTAATLVSIAVTPTNPSLSVGFARPMTATATFTDSTTQDVTAQVTWSSSDTAVATVSNATGTEGELTAHAVGTSTITATLGGKSGTTTVTVTNATLLSIEVTPTNPAVAVGLTRPFTATGVFSDASTQDLTEQVTWSSSDEAAATVSNATGTRGVATGVAVGQVTITATLGAVSGSTTLTVSGAALTSIVVAPATASVAKGLTQSFTATGHFSDATTQDLTTQVAWSSSNGAIATVSNAAGSEGLASAVATGTATITATKDGITGTAALTVTAATLTSIKVTPATPAVAKGLTVPFSATGTFSDTSTQDLTTQVTWSSSDTAIATVSNAAGSEGVATATGTGTATVTATLSGVSGTATLTVNAATLVSIAVTPASPSVSAGGTVQLAATGTFSDTSTQDLTTQVTWASLDPAIASVSNAAGSQGLATGVVAGSASITATLDGVTGSTTITVAGRTLTAITLSVTAPTLMQQQRVQVRATATFSDNSTEDVTATATWSTSDATIATVGTGGSNNGRVDAQQVAGSTTITATVGAISGSTVVTVSAVTCHVVVNEVQAGGLSGTGTSQPADEWVELYNPCTTTFDVTGWNLVYRSATSVGATDSSSLGALTGSMAPGDLRLHAHVASTRTGIADVTFGTGTNGSIGGTSGSVGLRAGAVDTGTLVDSVAYGTITAGNPFAEGGNTNAATALANGKSQARAPFDGKDSNVNKDDFALTATPTPKALNFP